MHLQFKLMEARELHLALALLKSAAERLKEKGVMQWRHWLKPDTDQVAWVQEGFNKNEFYAVENERGECVGMFRLMTKDLLYWGEQPDKAGYVHSLVVKKEFAHLNLGLTILEKIAEEIKKQGIAVLRLDCNAANKWLCNYYEQQGFVKTGEVQMSHSLNNLYEKKLA